MWWRLSLPLPPVLEESLLWKLESLGLHRLAVQHAPESPDQRTLLAWLTSVGVAAGSTGSVAEQPSPDGGHVWTCLGRAAVGGVGR